MVKGAVIFSDQDQNKKEEKNFPKSAQHGVNLSRDEYRQIIKDAYQEGRDDALKEHTKQEPANPDEKYPGLTRTNQEKLPAKLGEKEQTKKFTKQKEESRQRFKAITVPEQEKDTVEKEGKEEAIKLHAKQKEENKRRFRTITARHETVIMNVKGVFPFALFPDTLIIDTTKVSIAKKQLFATEHITTIPLKDVADVTVQTALFLASITVTYMPQMESAGIARPISATVPSLHRHDAIRAKNILKGVLVAKAEEIDIAKLPPEEVVKVIEKFGESTGVI